MVANYEKLMSLKIPDTEQSYGPKDVILYALSLGLGTDPEDARELSFIYEKDLRVLPTMGVVLANPGFWARTLDTGLDWLRIVHAEQGLVMHRPLPSMADVIGISRITEILDKGAAKGALISTERRILEKKSGEQLCTITQTSFCRGDGGIGGPTRPPAPLHTMPARVPDVVCDWHTLPQIALLYRLNGDWNPLHAEPAIARQAGFQRPILHGLATYGIAGYAVLKTFCDYDVGYIGSMFARFTAPAFPGEVLRTEMWQTGRRISYCVRAVERDVLVINNGYVELRE